MGHQLSGHQSAIVDSMLDHLKSDYIILVIAAARYIRPGAVVYKVTFDPDISMPFACVCFMLLCVM